MVVLGVKPKLCGLSALQIDSRSRCLIKVAMMKMMNIVVHACYSSTCKAEAGALEARLSWAGKA